MRLSLLRLFLLLIYFINIMDLIYLLFLIKIILTLIFSIISVIIWRYLHCLHWCMFEYRDLNLIWLHWQSIFSSCKYIRFLFNHIFNPNRLDIGTLFLWRRRGFNDEVVLIFWIENNLREVHLFYYLVWHFLIKNCN